MLVTLVRFVVKISFIPIESSCTCCEMEVHMESVFSNYLILKNIVTFLSYDDLLSWSEVNKFWRTQIRSCSGLLIQSYKIHFRDVEIPLFVDDWDLEHLEHPPTELHILVEEAMLDLRGSRTISQVVKPNLTELREILQESLKKRIISIELVISSEKIRAYESILREFGTYVRVIYSNRTHQSPSLSMFLNHVRYLPNLRVVKWNCLKVNEVMSENIPICPSVRSIHPGNFKWHWGVQRDPVQVQRLLKRVFPNVERIVTVPLNCLENVAAVWDLRWVKSFRYPKDEDTFKLPILETKFKEIADNNIKLAELEIPDTVKFEIEAEDFLTALKRTKKMTTFKGTTEARLDINLKIRREFYRILEQNQCTLETFVITPGEEGSSFLPLHLSLNSVKILKLNSGRGIQQADGDNFNKLTREFFPKGTKLNEMFPHVEEIHIMDSFCNKELDIYLPVEAWCPQNLRIKTLKIKWISPDIFPQLVRVFPLVEHFEFESGLDHFASAFPVIAKNLVKLRSIKAIMRKDGVRFSRDEGASHANRQDTCLIYDKWDKAFSGESESRSSTNTQKAPSLFDLTSKKLFGDSLGVLPYNFYLNRLDFDLTDAPSVFCYRCDRVHLLKILAAATAENVFKKLPYLKIGFWIRCGSQGRMWINDMKEALSPVKDSVEIGFGSILLLT